MDSQFSVCKSDEAELTLIGERLPSAGEVRVDSQVCRIVKRPRPKCGGDNREAERCGGEKTQCAGSQGGRHGSALGTERCGEFSAAEGAKAVAGKPDRIADVEDSRNEKEGGGDCEINGKAKRDRGGRRLRNDVDVGNPVVVVITVIVNESDIVGVCGVPKE